MPISPYANSFWMMAYFLVEEDSRRRMRVVLPAPKKPVNRKILPYELSIKIIGQMR